MTVLEIPIASSAPHYVQENDVFGQTFFLEFEWIEVEGFWLLHVADCTERPLSSGVKLQSEWPLYVHHDARLPFAFMLLPRLSGQTLDRTTLRNQFTLVAYAVV